MASIYLNHAGTSWPKPAPVLQAVAATWQADPGEWADRFERHHRRVAEFFHIPDHAQLLLSPACTSALAIAVADHFWNPGDRALISGYEHHALHRPIAKLVEQGVEVDVLPSLPQDPVILEALEHELRQGRVKLVAFTAACNVSGDCLPMTEMIQLAHQYGARVLVDAAQIGGWMDLDLPQLGADLVALAPHKGMQAPWGIGALYIAPDMQMNSSSAVCEIIYDEHGRVAAKQPSGPGWCDAGTVNRAALAGWAAAVDWLEQPAQAQRLSYARGLAEQFRRAVTELTGVEVLGIESAECRMPIVALTVAGRTSSELARGLAEQNVVAAGGLQCAPLAHKTLGSAPDGALRFSFGAANTPDDVQAALTAFATVLQHGSGRH